jgi:hypothetical protein
VLGVGSYDKPVIHVSDEGARRAHTPAMTAADHTTTNRTRIAIAADGAVTGETAQITTGVFAAGARMIAANIQTIGLTSAAESKLRSLGTPGTGRFEIGSLSQLDDTYVVKSNFTYNTRMKIVPRAVRPIPLGLPIHVRPGEYLLGKRYTGRTLPFVCRAGRQVEEIEITFADGLPMPRRVTGRTIDTRVFSYASHYRFENRTMKVRREFESRVPGQVCAPVVEAEIANDLKIVRGSINTRMSFPTAPVVPPAAKTDVPANKVDSGTGSGGGEASQHAKLVPPAAPAATVQPEID